MRTASVADNWVRKIIDNRPNDEGFIVGPDIEWKPSFIKGHTGQVVLLQLCVDRMPDSSASPPRSATFRAHDALVKEVLGLEVSKSNTIRISDWSKRDHTDAQIEYAFIDAYVCSRLGVLLMGRQQIK
ncbi:hypothetical protein AMTR_s00002p00011760 [Amborella trichopoda]|uniref:3'-5' exonuclease domain-containing protein n=1 Tax=Amborella trichopoda TaxID=13333 RepID=W1P031_AMBTC|nr:hypothetical protein AMTR_s00002p00011760 [Amborella trichopoda]